MELSCSGTRDPVKENSAKVILDKSAPSYFSSCLFTFSFALRMAGLAARWLY